MQLATSTGLDTRSRLLEAAAKRVHQQGFFNTSLEQIASDVDIAKATIYHHFKNKEDLGRALIDYHTSRYLDFLRRDIFKPQASGLQRLQTLCDYTLRELRQGELEKGCPICNLVSELSNGSDMFRSLLEQFFTAYRQLIQQALDQAVAAGQIVQDVATPALASLFLAQLQGSILLARTRIQKGQTEAAAQMLDENFSAFFKLLTLPS